MSATAFNFMRRRQKELEEKRNKLAGKVDEPAIPETLELPKEKSLEEHSNAELKEMLDSKSIKYSDTATKKELIELIQDEVGG